MLAPQREGAAVDEAVPESRDPAQLGALLEQLRHASEAEMQRLAGQVNELLIAMRAPGNEAAEAKAVLAQLDVGALDGLYDQRNRSCRAEAVETLIASGFPHALQLNPADLEHRDEVRSFEQSEMIKGGMFLAGLAVVSIAIKIAEPTVGWLDIIGGVGTLASFPGWLLLRKPPGKK